MIAWSAFNRSISELLNVNRDEPSFRLCAILALFTVVCNKGHRRGNLDPKEFTLANPVGGNGRVHHVADPS